MITAEVREVKLISPQVDLSNIPSPKAFPWLSFNFSDPQGVLAQVRQSAPSNGQDVVGWMQDAAALNAYAQVTEETYNSIGAIALGSSSGSGSAQLLSAVGDGFIPGVRISNSVYFVSQNGYQVQRQGYAVVGTPYGQYQVPVGGNALIAVKDLLAWAAVPYTYWIQFLAALFQWLRLARVPFSQKVTFPTAGNMTGPQFFDVSPGLPLPGVLLIIGLESPSDQDVIIAGRGPSGSYDSQYFSKTVHLQQGQQDVYLFVYGFPAVSEFTLEVWPQNGSTVIDYIKTVPPI
jgi:hypothetical protein